jgi:NADH-quinone oxidoreductase subunit M
LTIYISFLGVVLLMCLPRDNARAARFVALGTALAGLFVGVTVAVGWDPAPEVVNLVNVPWVPTLGIGYHLGFDGISLTLVLLTGIAAVAGVLFSWNVEHRAKEFFAFFLILIGAVYGVFLSFDLFLLFVFYEIAIIPKYFLIAIWGSTRKEYGAMKLALYSLVGSAMVLVGMIAAWVVAGGQSFDLVTLSQHAFPLEFQRWAFPLVFVGFAVLAGMWPFHTWAPTGHVAAPTAASMLLAGVIMKLGAYGCLRVAMTLFPEGVVMWQHEIALLAVVGIVYGAGLSGAVLQMFSHGIIAGLLFAVVGRMVYDRTHTREFGDLELMRLDRMMPFAAVIFVLASMASMGLPGFSGFIAELQVIIGAWRAFPTLAVVAGIGIVIGVAYTLRAMHHSFFAGAETKAGEEGPPMEPISVPERVGALLLVAVTLLVGLYPRVLLDLIVPALQSPLFDGLMKGGGQ